MGTRSLASLRAPALVLFASFFALAPSPASAAGANWERWQTTIPGVFDLGGPRSDGLLVAAGSANLYLADPAGNVVPFAQGPGGYHEDPGGEAYLAVSPRARVVGAGCNFARDDVFLLRLHAPLGVERVDSAGQNTGAFADIPGVTSLGGIAFDTTGAFDHRLLATGASGGKTVVSAIDCYGTVQVITRSAPSTEGGLAVAPEGFGSFGGDLLAPDEYTGRIYAIAPDGSVATVAQPALPTGGDIGVESLGFVPAGFMEGGEVYYADRKTPNNAHPGTDAVLRLSSAYLSAAGVRDGDLLAATEGGATLIAVHCDATCSVITVVATQTTSHGEGHIVFTVEKTVPSPIPSPTMKAAPKTTPSRSSDTATNAVIATAIVIALVALVLALGVPRRRT
ncbi:MAG TPA: hypothetical protein VG426_14360 [Candidatus Dormibacteraeota bacterium]|nr:hypothetical protein [Candidatus Dormibacteraeota bacterium]